MAGAGWRPRRRRLALAGGLSLGLALLVWSAVIEPDLLRVQVVGVETERWPADLPPLRIAAVADLHAGAPHVDAAKLQRIVAEVNALRPDVVLLLGDYVISRVLFGHRMPPEEIARQLAGLRAPAGMFAVLGNHDWYEGGERIARALREAGIVVLENQAVPLPGSNGRIWLAGFADSSTRSPDPAGTVAGIPEQAAVVALAHDPAVFAATPRRVAVLLAGHTHGGQIALPFWGPLVDASRAPLRHARGLIREDGKTMYVSTGIGTSYVPLRFAAPPEIVALTVRSAGDDRIRR